MFKQIIHKIIYCKNGGGGGSSHLKTEVWITTELSLSRTKKLKD